MFVRVSEVTYDGRYFKDEIINTENIIKMDMYHFQISFVDGSVIDLDSEEFKQLVNMLNVREVR